MNKQMRILLLAVGIGLAPFCFSAVPLQAQQNEMQRAHDAGYQNGVNAARQNKPMNLNTDDWHGDRLNAYRQGYEEGYRSIRGAGENGRHGYQNSEDQKAYQAGYRNGVHDRESNHPMNMSSGNWKADRLDAYRKGYEQGYHAREHGHERAESDQR